MSLHCDDYLEVKMGVEEEESLTKDGSQPIETFLARHHMLSILAGLAAAYCVGFGTALAWLS